MPNVWKLFTEPELYLLHSSLMEYVGDRPECTDGILLAIGNEMLERQKERDRRRQLRELIEERDSR